MAEVENLKGKINDLNKQEDETRINLRVMEREKKRLEEVVIKHKSKRINGFGNRLPQVADKVRQNEHLFKDRNNLPIGPIGKHICLTGDAATENKLAILISSRHESIYQHVTCS